MSYLVLARKWRPQKFADLIGQEHVSRTLQNAIDSGRVAHAFLFTGARGVGKTSAARILAKALECEAGPSTEPCNICSACVSITSGNAVDVFEIDGASNTGVDDIRELRENIKYLPSSLRYKIFIIDEVHMLSTNAFNALLKTLEEPPAHVKFIFATTEPHKLPVTILSRCQRFDFKRIPLQKISDRLRYIADQENISVSNYALTVISRKGDGSMRDSLSTLDQVLAFCGDTVADEEVAALLGVVDRRLLLEASSAVFARNAESVLEIVKRVDEFGYSMRHFCQELINHFRNLAIAGLVENAAKLLDLAEAEMSEIGPQARSVKQDEMQRHLSILLKAESEMAASSFPRLVLELALVRMCNLAPVVPIHDLLEKLQALENLKTTVVPVAPSKVTQPPPRRAEPSKEESLPQADDERRPEQDEAQVGKSWSGFVTYVLGKRAGLGSVLEHGHPLSATPPLIKVGFPTGSFYLSSVRDPETVAAVKGLAEAYFKAECKVEVVALEKETKDLPLSESQKKNFHASERIAETREKGSAHPMVIAALEILGGEISEIAEIEE